MIVSLSALAGDVKLFRPLAAEPSRMNSNYTGIKCAKPSKLLTGSPQKRMFELLYCLRKIQTSLIQD